jgi:hypothetical protein
VAPLADRSARVCRLLASHRDYLAHLLRREFCRRTFTWRIGQPRRHAEVIQGHVSKLQPPSSPVARRLVIDAQLPSNLQVVDAVASRQHYPRP